MIVSDAEKPSVEPPRVAQLGEVAPGEEECLRGGVLGPIDVPKHRADVAGDRRDASTVDLGERLPVTSLGACNELLEGVRAEELAGYHNLTGRQRHR